MIAEGYNAPDAHQAPSTNTPPENLPRTSKEYVLGCTADTARTEGRNSFLSTFKMFSIINLDKFKGDGTQDVKTWFTNFGQWAKFHDLPDEKIIDAFPFYLEGHAKIWYDSLSAEQKLNHKTIKNLFQERFKELDKFLDLSVLQMKQDETEPVDDFLTRLIKKGTIKNISDKILLSVAMNGLRSDIRTHVVTQNPKSIEQLRKIAILAEKFQPSQSITLENYEHLLTEIQSLKEKIKTQSEINDMKCYEAQNKNQPQYFASQNCKELPAIQNHRVRYFSPTQQTPIYLPRRQNIRVNRSRTARNELPEVNVTPTTLQLTHHPRMIAPQCYFCLGTCMDRSRCPARNAHCHNCNRVGNFSRACKQSCSVHQKRFAPISRKCLSNSKVQNPYYKRQSQQLEYDQNTTQKFKSSQQSNRKQKKSQKNSIELHEMESRDALISFKEKCSIPVFVQSARFNALLDTGSAISAINSETLNKIKINENKLKNSEISFITGAGGTAHTVYGKIELELKIGGLKFKQMFYVIQDLCKSLILGTDFMEKQKACIDWGTKTLYLQEFSTYVNIINVSNGLARVSKTITVQPNGFANIPIKLSRTQKNHTVLLEPNGNTQKQLGIAKCLVINRPKRVFIQVANASNKNICLTAGTIIATVSTICTQSISSIDENSTTSKSKYKHVPLDLTSAVLSDQQKQIFQEFINQNSDVFANDLSELGKCNNYYHSIKTETEKPIQSQPYRTSPKAKL